MLQAVIWRGRKAGLKKGIVLYALYKENWIGGIYYIKSMALQLVQNNDVIKKYNVFIMTNTDCKNYYCDIDSRIHVIVLKERKFLKVSKFFNMIRYHIRYRYPHEKDVKILGLKSIQWIPDFQDSYYPELFTAEELEFRKKRNERTAKSNQPLVLSSETCISDFRKFYSPVNSNIHVVHFVSYISDIISELTLEYETMVLKKYDIEQEKFACIMNQFWQHKNHMVAFEAVKNIVEVSENEDFIIVMTGLMEDYRNPAYIQSLKEMADHPKVASHIRLLGLIDRKEQLAIMKNAAFVIQPSLFEGWGTVLEDAKVLDKTVLLSDIPVHREQKHDKSIFFDPYDSKKLAQLIIEEFSKKHDDDLNKGIEDMYRRAKEYSKELEDLFMSL